MSHFLSPEQAYRLLREDVALAAPDSDAPGDPLGRLTLVEVTGAERLEWLQGQSTNDLRALQEGQSIEFCVLKPTGQIVAPCQMWHFEARSLIETPRLCAEGLLQRFETMVILEDVQARDISGDYTLKSLQGPNAKQTLLSMADSAPISLISLESDHSGAGGVDIWVPVGIEFGHEQTGPLPSIPAKWIQAARIEAGIPYFGVDMGARTLPPEMGAAFEGRNVSYTKGCYVGQEVLARIHSRGHTNKTWMGLLCGLPVERGQKVLSEDGAECGEITSAAVSPVLGPIAGATLGNDFAQAGMSVVVCVPGGSIRAEVRPFPLV